MYLDLINDLGEIARLKNDWNALSLDQPFQSWEWHHSWYRSFSRSTSAAVVLEQLPGEQITAIAPLYTTRRSALGTSKLRFAADGNICTDYRQFISRADTHSYFVAKFVIWLRSVFSIEANVDFVELDGLAAEADSTHHLIDQLKIQGFNPRCQAIEHCWAVPLAESWEELDATFSRKLRRKTNKAAGRLEDSEIYDSGARDFEYLWSNLVELHQQRRRSVGGRGCFSDPRFEQFLKTATRGLIDRGLAEILVVEHQQQPIAATLLFHDRQTCFMYQTGFSPEFSRFEPGYMLVVAAMQWSIDRRIRTFDFMRGDEPYKARWNTRPRQLVRLRVQLRHNLRANLENRFLLSKRRLRSSFAGRV